MLLLLGDSLTDSGNLGFKASDGYVLGEQISIDLGLIDPNYPARGFSTEIDLISNSADNSFLTDPVVNFSFFSASTGIYGSKTDAIDLSGRPIGLASQATLVLGAYTNPFFAAVYGKADVVLSVGSNDLFQFLDAEQGPILAALGTRTRRDDKALIDTISGQVVGNIAEQVERLQTVVDDVVILGVTSLEKTPLLQQVASRLPAPLDRAFTGLVADMVQAVNRGLAKVFRKERPNPGLGRTDDGSQEVLVIDGVVLFDRLEDVPGFGFADVVHPNSFTSGLFAEAVVGEIDRRLPGFATSPPPGSGLV